MAGRHRTMTMWASQAPPPVEGNVVSTYVAYAPRPTSAPRRRLRRVSEQPKRSTATALPAADARQYSIEIEGALSRGDVDAAYDRFQEWIARETRRASCGGATNVVPLMGTMLYMLSWMHERVPRSMSVVAAGAAAR